MNVLFILNDPPYGSERCYNALRLANALPKHDPAAEVTVFLNGGCRLLRQERPEDARWLLQH